MKKIISIFLILLLLFNALGFYGLFVGMRYKTTTDLVRRLDNQQYSDAETITLKVPFAIPYQLDAQAEYERVDGEIKHQGEFYRLVKQKLEKDTLYIVCIKDHESKRIDQALEDYVKTFTDKPANAKHTGKNLTSFIKDFLPTSIEISPVSKGWNYTMKAGTCSELPYTRSLTVFTPPPKS